MTDEELDDQVIDWFVAEKARWRAAGRRAIRYVLQLLVVLIPLAAFMYVTGLIESIR